MMTNRVHRVILRKAGSRCVSLFLFVLMLSLLLLPAVPATAESAVSMKPSALYARCAVLMDGDTGRVLFSKNGEEQAPMASTTKILTCIIALENGSLSDTVEVSEEAASQPKVRLGMKEGQRFSLKDLLYSLMLESHNDAAVAVAEHIGGSVPGFADMMNRKAKEIGADSSYFITPNGLDAEDENGVHHTTAKDLALILRYCIMESGMRDEFLEITRTPSYTFSDCSKEREYACTNHNAFLKMMDGALTGKTGFTADAGYCYVGALKSDDGRTFIVALLACGWPGNKNYKWSDTRKLMTYGLEHYTYRDVAPEEDCGSIRVIGGYAGGFPDKGGVEVPVRSGGTPGRILAGADEEVTKRTELPASLSAPVEEGDQVGRIEYAVDGMVMKVDPVCTAGSVQERTADICRSWIVRKYFLQKGD